MFAYIIARYYLFLFFFFDARSSFGASRSCFKVSIACIAAERPVRSLNLDSEGAKHDSPKLTLARL